MDFHKQGLSSIEIFMVMIIMFILMSIIVIAMIGAVKAANDAERKSNIAQFMKIIVASRIKSGEYPIEPEECSIGKNCYSLDPVLKSQRLIEIPQDPRGGDYYYKYESDGRFFTLKCLMGDNSDYIFKSN